MTDWNRVPGYVSHRDGPEMPTVTIETGRIREACEHARDELGFNVCVDLVATDYLGWGGVGVSGYIGTASGRDLMHPMTQGLQALPEAKPKRFSISYHLLALRQVYDQMLEPKWVIAMGACASSGGMFNNYTTLQGVDKIVAVDIHVPGCPPRPEALMEGIVRLHEKVMAGVPPAYELRGVAS